MTPKSPLAEKIESEPEWTPAAAIVHDQIIRQFTEKVTAIAERDPQALLHAIAIIVQAGAGREVLVLSDPSANDIVTELRQYAEEGARSPLTELLKAHHPL